MWNNVILAYEPWGLSTEEKLLPEYLKDQGYATHIVGKWHLGFFQQQYTPTFRGFDSHFGYWSGQLDYYNHSCQQLVDVSYTIYNYIIIK
jgi:arylsulfatase A-like enzyme